MKQLFIMCLALLTSMSFAQDKDKEKELQRTLETAKDYVYQGNELVDAENYINAEMEYRKAISKAPSVVAGAYNLGNSYYEKGNYEEALFRHAQAAETATSKAEKHKAYHNMGNILMKEELCQEAVEAYKNALRNNPTDDETRYNFAIAKDCAEQQKKQDQDKEEDKKDEDKEDDKNQEDKKEDDQKKDDPKDEGDQDKKDGDDQNDEGKPKDEKDNGEGDKKEDQKQNGKPKPQPGQLSPQQIKNLLEAMNNQEQKVQEKINAEKQKGVKVKTEKDW
ncbi:tetratricopeptide repeat protein [Psychroserpens algicola]|uniref:Tetratricopeptide repeat protein n=1 Tax=Psychroserpens algicola TaxID=1719034 RepID=A0ABT0H7B6_9FLAO|nr:tetratricopeptide repeat protein [Psychroserpens algicola]MCK8480253.1 tetratricopeptide repeat protein [Psychroserpens algicola]